MRAACGCRLGSIPGRLVALWYYKRICLPSASSTYFFGRRFIMQELCQPRVSYSYTHTCVYTYVHKASAAGVCVPCHKPPAGRKRWIRLPPASIYAWLCALVRQTKRVNEQPVPHAKIFLRKQLCMAGLFRHAIGKSRMDDKKQHESNTISFVSLYNSLQLALLEFLLSSSSDKKK
jgi:hypothetical protein